MNIARRSLWWLRRAIVLVGGLLMIQTVVLIWMQLQTQDSGRAVKLVQVYHRSTPRRVIHTHNRTNTGSLSDCRFETAHAEIQTDLRWLRTQLADQPQFAWILHRIEDSWSEWVATARQTRLKPDSGTMRLRKRFLVVPGVLMGTEYGSAASISGGGPLGDLVQWADLLAGLHVLGHNVTVMSDIYRAIRGVIYGKLLDPPYHDCNPFDAIFVDIIFLKLIPYDMFIKLRCKFRVLDAYGTEAKYNNGPYADRHGTYSAFGLLDLHLKQFFTFYRHLFHISSRWSEGVFERMQFTGHLFMYKNSKFHWQLRFARFAASSHTPDNSFLGFVVWRPTSKRDILKEDIGLLYGKDIGYFKSHYNYIERLAKDMEIHATLANTSGLPSHVINEGILTSEQYGELLDRSKYLIGVGQPLESTGAMEALARGCIFLNPRFRGKQRNILQTMNKPTSRTMSSQIPYLEESVGDPHVFTLDITDPDDILRTLERSRNLKVNSFVPHEFTAGGFVERLHFYVSGQDFCPHGHYGAWRDPGGGRKGMRVALGRNHTSCQRVCRQKGLTCFREAFPLINAERIFKDVGISCREVISGADVLFPAAEEDNGICRLQNEESLFSCAEAHYKLRRLCPCRAINRNQTALCVGCV